MIELHSNRTPNSQKIIIMLEEIGATYRKVEYDILKGEHLTSEFGTLNPNYKLPVIVDHFREKGKEPLVVFESGAILFYLAEKSGEFLPGDVHGRMRVMEWLIWQVAGLGPMFGQAGHFLRFAPENQDYAVRRYSNESVRLLNVLERRLNERTYLADNYSIADMACWPWVHQAASLGIALGNFPSVYRWHDLLLERPAYQLLTSGAHDIPPAMLQGRVSLTPEQWSATFGERMLSAPT